MLRDVKTDCISNVPVISTGPTELRKFSTTPSASEQGSIPCRLHDHEKERAQWQKERQALEEQVASVRAEWQSKWDKAVTDINKHQRATAETADQLQQSLE